MQTAAQRTATQTATQTAGSEEVIERLRAQIRTLEAQPRQWLMALRTGVEALDAWGVFRLGSGVELSGEEASGRTSLALTVVAAAGREQRLAAWVDGPAELYPPSAVALGVDLERLLIARPKAPGQLVWTAVQLLRSAAFACVVLDVTHTGLRLSTTDAKKLLDAARAGGSLLLVVTSLGAPAQGLVRLLLRTAATPQGVVRRLKVVEADGVEADGDGGGAGACAGEAIDRSFSVETARGSKLSLSLPGRGLLRARRVERLSALPWVPQVHSEPSLQRPRKHRLREGYGSIQRQGNGGHR